MCPGRPALGAGEGRESWSALPAVPGAEPRQGALCSFSFFDFKFFYFFGLKKKRANDCSFSRGKSSFYSLYLPYFFSSPHVIVRIKPPLHPSELREGWCGFFLFYFLYPHFYILKKK